MGQGETPRTEEAWVSHLLQGEVAEGVLTGRGRGKEPSGKAEEWPQVRAVYPRFPFPVKEAAAKGVAEGDLRRVGKGQWDPREEGGKNEAHKGL